MAIDKINNVNPINQTSKVNRATPVSKTSADSIQISSEARDMLSQNRIDETLSKIPDIRMDKVQEAKERLSTYMDNGVIRKDVLEKMSEAMIDEMFFPSITDGL